MTNLVALLLMVAAARGAPARKDPVIEGIVKEISARNIEATIRKLVSFHTRHTLSDPNNEERGVGAARKWIAAEFERYSKRRVGA
jgi:hypothetical protein